MIDDAECNAANAARLLQATRTNSHRRCRLLFSVSLLAMGLSATTTQAQQNNWVGNRSTDWFVGGNWSRGEVPKAGDFVQVLRSTGDMTVIDGLNTGRTAIASYIDVYSRLVIQNGGILQTEESNVNGNGTVGIVTLTGAGSSWTSSDHTFIGFDGSGTVNIENGAALHGSGTTIGVISGSNGFVTVTGAGSTLIDTNEIDVGREGAGTLSVENGGAVSGPINIAMVGGSTGTLNIGAAAVKAAVAPGVINGSITFGNGNGAINFNHTANDYEFGSQISGGGTINAWAGETTLTGNSSGFSGHTSVKGGTLAVNGTLGGTLDVLTGGRLQGAGSIGTTTVAKGSTIAPGNSVGTLNINGDITLSFGSTYEVEADSAGSTDLIAASGKAMLQAGTVALVGTGGSFAPNSTYTILTAKGGIQGTFYEIKSDLAFLDPKLAYTTNDVTLTLTHNGASFASVGATDNHAVVGAAIESLGSGHDIHDLVVGLSDDGARLAFDLHSGEIHASTKTVLIEDSGLVRDVVTDRVRAAFGDIAAPAMPVLSFGPDEAAPAVADTSGFAAWGSAFGAWSSIDGDGNAAGIDHSTGGFLVGGDALVGENWRVGLFTGYSRTSFETDELASSGDSDSIHLGAYAGTQWGALGLRLGAAYNWHDIETSRSIRIGEVEDSLEASYDAGTAQVFGELGYRIDTPAVSFEPFAGLAYVALDSDAFTEDGGAAGLAVEGGSTDTTFTTLGLRAAGRFMLGSVQATAHGVLGWRHAFGDVTPATANAFAGSDAFTISGVPIAEDAALLEAGLDFDLTDKASFGIAYAGQVAEDAREHGFQANLTVRF